MYQPEAGLLRKRPVKQESGQSDILTEYQQAYRLFCGTVIQSINQSKIYLNKCKALQSLYINMGTVGRYYMSGNDTDKGKL